ncbi:putative lactoylglutathione lyase [Candidatus Sulfotelmatomonas gaucii]|uniref:Putative lactoylglutathione lyase n=1 Tax=Candidatus Sulfuritelmatomonas gaucii TaxID=2043161 RepID=A0A2N9LWQ3_9BACT|nr:putative lactoylglutathione lyase [Candidatus Sulfotelmatomonas gaucii]
MMSGEQALVPAKIELGGVTPVLRVADVEASIRYYVDKLGFKVKWGYPADGEASFVSISRGKTSLFLSAGDQGHPGSWVWIDGKDVDRLHEEFKLSGARIRNPPTNYAWALEMQVEDLDGNILRIGSDPRPGEPIGEWLDMHGQRWRPESDSTWTLVQAK